MGPEQNVWVQENGDGREADSCMIYCHHWYHYRWCLHEEGYVNETCHV